MTSNNNSLKFPVASGLHFLFTLDFDLIHGRIINNIYQGKLFLALHLPRRMKMYELNC